MHMSKYGGKTNLDHWLEDYHLAMKARGQMMTSPSSTFPACIKLNQSLAQAARSRQHPLLG
jgi:hypothetical protein